MFSARTDLAEELRTGAMARDAKASVGELDGVLYREREANGVRISTIDVTSEDGEKKLGRKMGRYVTVSYASAANLSYAELLSLCDIVAEELRAMTGDISSVLICGLGNRELSADAVGVRAAEHILVTHHMKEKDSVLFSESGFFDVSAICPGVMAKTGMEAAEITRSIVERFSPDAVVAIDSLAARETARLARTIQLCNTGISPGSGVGNRRAAFDHESLGVPVIAIGVPTVVDCATLVSDALEGHPVKEETLEKLSGLFVAPKEIDEILCHTARILGYAVNRAFHGDFSYEEMEMMT